MPFMCKHGITQCLEYLLACVRKVPLKVVISALKHVGSTLYYITYTMFSGKVALTFMGWFGLSVVLNTAILKIRNCIMVSLCINIALYQWPWPYFFVVVIILLVFGLSDLVITVMRRLLFGGIIVWKGWKNYPLVCWNYFIINMVSFNQFNALVASYSMHMM